MDCSSDSVTPSNGLRPGLFMRFVERRNDDDENVGASCLSHATQLSLLILPCAMVQSMTDSIFDAFFWIEPSRADVKSAFNSTKVIWHYPDDVSHITKEFRDIPQFCFPDLPKMKLEKAQGSKSEHFTFTLTGSDGRRIYGVCMRGLFRGTKRRHDVGRRPRHCLCFITRFPFFSAFKSMLLEVHAIALLEQHPGSCRKFLEAIYQQSIYQSETRVGGYVKSITASQSAVPDLIKDFHVTLPRSGRVSNKEVPILPLFEALGIDRFFKLLSAVMCERRIIFIADEVDTLSSTVLAAASMLYPFSWHHIFIPLLPAKLLSYVAAPMPYMMGVRRYLLPELYREALDGVLIVDADSGDIQVHGEVVIKDLVGDSGNALKQASESFDRVRAGVTNMFLGKVSGTSLSGGFNSSSGGSGGSDSNKQDGPRDIMAMLLSDLKSLIANKPGSASIQSVASGLLRGLPGQVKSTEEAKAQWTLESEKVLRDNLACFFVYLFGDMDDFAKPQAVAAAAAAAGGNQQQPTREGKIRAGEKFGDGDSRTSFDLRALAYRRNQMGDSKYLQDFMSEFIHSQMFERFCDEKLTKFKTLSDVNTRSNHSNSTTSSTSGGSGGGAAVDAEVEELFDSACAELRSRNMQLTVANARSVVHARSSAITSSNGDSSVGKVMGSNFHQLTLQYTSNSTHSRDRESANSGSGGGNNTSSGYANLDNNSEGVSEIDVELNVTSSGDNAHNRYNSPVMLLERICAEAHYSDVFLKIMNTIAFRLEHCRVSSCRGSAGSSGVRAMSLLRSLILSGPHCTLSYALDMVPIIRKLIKIGNHNAAKYNKHSSGGLSGGGSGVGSVGEKLLAAQALEFISNGSAVDPRPQALALIGLLFDHNKVVIQQKYEIMRKEGAFPYLTINSRSREPNSRKLGIFGSKQFPSFAALHAEMNSAGLPCVGAGIVKVTPPELLVRHTEHEDGDGDGDDDDDNSSPNPANTTSTFKTGSHNSGRLAAGIIGAGNNSNASNKSSASHSQQSSFGEDPFATPFGESVDTTTAAPPTPAAGSVAGQRQSGGGVRISPPLLPGPTAAPRSNNVSPMKRISVSIAPPPPSAAGGAGASNTAATAAPGQRKNPPSTAQGAAAVVDLLNYEEISQPVLPPAAPPVAANTTRTTGGGGDVSPARYRVENKMTGEEVTTTHDFASQDVPLDTAKYRVVNLDTGDVMDIRDIAKLQQEAQSRRRRQLQQQQQQSMKLAPPPASGKSAPRRPSVMGSGGGGGGGSTDPFSLASVKSGFADAWGSVTSAVTTDPFGFTTFSSFGGGTSGASGGGGSASKPSSGTFTPTGGLSARTNSQSNMTASSPAAGAGMSNITTTTTTNAHDDFKPSTSWSPVAANRPAPAQTTATAPMPAPGPVQAMRPQGGVFPSSNVINSGAMGGYSGAPAPASAPRSMHGHGMGGHGHGMGGTAPVNPFNNSMSPPVNVNNNRPPMMMQVPPQQQQFQVRQVQQGAPGVSGAQRHQAQGGQQQPPKDPFADLLNIK